MAEGARATTTPTPLPSFLIVGAQQSGTGWLRDNLGLHGEIFVAPRELRGTALRLVLEQGISLDAVATQLSIPAALLQSWRDDAVAQATDRYS
jgi:hypothetical protein